MKVSPLAPVLLAIACAQTGQGQSGWLHEAAAGHIDVMVMTGCSRSAESPR
jgi:hypothetical protein